MPNETTIATTTRAKSEAGAITGVTLAANARRWRNRNHRISGLSAHHIHGSWGTLGVVRDRGDVGHEESGALPILKFGGFDPGGGRSVPPRAIRVKGLVIRDQTKGH